MRSAHAAVAPTRDRPQLPKGYISRAAKGMLEWSDAERILRSGRYLWLATTDAGGRPHLVQQWGVWVDERLYFEGSERTLWARNLARDPRVGFGTQVGSRAAYGDATVDVLRGAPQELAEKIAHQYAAKYGRAFAYRPTAKQYREGPVFRATPSKLVVFDVKEFSTSATRFTFGQGGLH